MGILAAFCSPSAASWLELPGGHAERAVYIAAGTVALGDFTYGAGKMLVLGAHASRLRAVDRASVLVLGGELLGDRYIHWNFVSSSRDWIAQAMADWQAGRMQLPDADDAAFEALPDGATFAPDPKKQNGDPHQRPAAIGDASN